MDDINKFYWVKNHTNILLYDISCKILIGAKPLRVMFNIVDRFLRDFDGTKYLVLFGVEKCDAIYDRTRDTVGLKAVLHMVFLIIIRR